MCCKNIVEGWWCADVLQKGAGQIKEEDFNWMTYLIRSNSLLPLSRCWWKLMSEVGVYWHPAAEGSRGHQRAAEGSRGHTDANRHSERLWQEAEETLADWGVKKGLKIWTVKSHKKAQLKTEVTAGSTSCWWDDAPSQVRVGLTQASPGLGGFQLGSGSERVCKKVGVRAHLGKHEGYNRMERVPGWSRMQQIKGPSSH